MASNDQLRALLEDEEPAVRVYAFWALSDRTLVEVPYGALLAHAKDHGRVRTQFGCIGSEQSAFDLMLEHVEHQLSEAQLAEVQALRAQAKRAESATPAGASQ